MKFLRRYFSNVSKYVIREQAPQISQIVSFKVLKKPDGSFFNFHTTLSGIYYAEQKTLKMQFIHIALVVKQTRYINKKVRL